MQLLGQLSDALDELKSKEETLRRALDDTHKAQEEGRREGERANVAAARAREADVKVRPHDLRS